ncbi:hypothetical protein Tco_0880899 [Tanacetum coccineum]
MAFLSAVATLRFPSTNNQLRTSSNLRNQATIQDDKVTVQQVQGRQGQSYTGTGYKGVRHMARQCTQPKRPRNAVWFKEKVMLAEAQESGQILDEEQLAFLVDPGIPDSQAAQIAILNNAAFQTKDLDAYDSDCVDVFTAQAVLMANLSNYGSDVISEGFEQTPVVDLTDNKITSDSNIISYSQYLQEMQRAAVQDTNLYAQQDSMILSVIEQMSEQMINHRLNIDLSTREKMIDSQMDDMIKEKHALKQQIDSLKQNLSNQIKEKESLLQTFTVFKNEFKEKESKYIDKEIDLEKKIKELDNIVYKVGQFAQTMHIDIDFRRSRSKMLVKQNDPISKEKKINTTPINHVELNQLSNDFGKCFVPQQELSAELAFWLQTSHPNTDQSDISPVKIEAPRELPKVSMVNTSLKKLKYHLGNFDTVVKKQITPDAIIEGEWGLNTLKLVF